MKICRLVVDEVRTRCVATTEWRFFGNICWCSCRPRKLHFVYLHVECFVFQQFRTTQNSLQESSNDPQAHNSQYEYVSFVYAVESHHGIIQLAKATLANRLAHVSTSTMSGINQINGSGCELKTNRTAFVLLAGRCQRRTKLNGKGTKIRDF